jgi:hypothetical protein
MARGANDEAVLAVILTERKVCDEWWATDGKETARQTRDEELNQDYADHVSDEPGERYANVNSAL